MYPKLIIVTYWSSMDVPDALITLVHDERRFNCPPTTKVSKLLTELPFPVIVALTPDQAK